MLAYQETITHKRFSYWVGKEIPVLIEELKIEEQNSEKNYIWQGRNTQNIFVNSMKEEPIEEKLKNEVQIVAGDTVLAKNVEAGRFSLHAVAKARA